jgi:hypothetical protein
MALELSHRVLFAREFAEDEDKLSSKSRSRLKNVFGLYGKPYEHPSIDPDTGISISHFSRMSGSATDFVSSSAPKLSTIFKWIEARSQKQNLSLNGGDPEVAPLFEL